MKIILLFLIETAFFLPILALASEDEFHDREDTQCVDRSGGITVNLLRCNSKSWKNIKPILDKEKNRIKSRMSTSQKLIFDRAETRWFKKIEAGCVLPDETGTLGDIAYGACINDETIKRIKWLRAHYPRR